MLKLTENAIECCRDVGRIAKVIAKHDRSLADQLRRAITSVALNAAEGTSAHDGNGRQRFRTALGSAREVDVALRVAEALGYLDGLDAALMQKLDRICAALWKLTR
ncbi:four helix bundle protein [Sandaracinus amylolyticus]|uniref:Four helix bundle protein n=1 Tax=Sandaracinus amylolyticus TaxID=927083 RepID=A0A0F6W9I4_9BACT|nr:four helix bundle protein [Sandaracinus amylolyticus]AKF10836.1 hypothetical protein DB32_007985 [Sandaracinus amylolyticus]